MHIPGRSYRSRMVDHGASVETEPADAPASAPDELASRLAQMGLGTSDRRRASDVGADLGPRIARSRLGESMRLQPASSALLVDDRHYIHSARHDLAAGSRGSGGFMSALKKGAKKGVKGLKQALGFGQSRSGFSGSVGSSARDSIDGSGHYEEWMSRMDAPSPSRGVPWQVPEDEAIGAQVTQHSNPPNEAPAPQAQPARRRRPRDEARESARRLSGSSMRAEETKLPPPDPARRKEAYAQDLPLIGRARAGLEANPRIPRRTKSSNVMSLIEFSAWLKQVGKLPMEGRLFSRELMFDAWSFIRLGGHQNAPSALTHLRQMETSSAGVTEIPRQEHRRNKEVPEEDGAFIEMALHAKPQYRNAARSFSEWLAGAGYPALTDLMVDGDGVTWRALHFDEMTQFAETYKNSPGAKHARSVMGALKQLRIFDTAGATSVKGQSHHLGIPEVDQRLIGRYQTKANAQLQEQAQRLNEPVLVDKYGHTKVDGYAGHARAYSDWRQQQGLPTIAAQLHDGTLIPELELFAEPGTTRFRSIRIALRDMAVMFSPEAPEVSIARIGRERFVNALGSLAPNATVAEVASRVGAEIDDLLVFLDARSPTGLTRAGQDLVNTFEGALRQAANANIALRVQAWRDAPQGALPALAQTPSSFVLPATPSGGWSNFSWMDDPAGQQQYGGAAGSAQHGTDSIYGDLGSLDSVARHIGLEPYPSSPSVSQPARTDSAYEGLSSLGSVSQLGGWPVPTAASLSRYDREDLQDDAHYGGPSGSVGTGVSSDVWDMPSRQPPYAVDTGHGAHAPAWSPAPVAHHPAEDIGPAVGDDWRHGRQIASDLLVVVLTHRGLLPTQYMPQTTFHIHGQPYTATLDPGMQPPTDLNPMGLKVRLAPRLQGG